MKRVAFVCLLLINVAISAQKKSILEGAEVFVSVNRTTFFDDKTENRTGFGAGIKFLYNSDKRFSLLTGFEYNHTRQYKYELFEDRWCSSSDWEISVHLFSIPVGVRYRVGSMRRIIVEGGVFADVPYKSTREGERCCYYPDLDNLGNMAGGCSQVTESGIIFPGFGSYFGVGYRIPISKVDLIIKPDYKFVFNRINSQDDIYNRYLRFNFILKFK